MIDSVIIDQYLVSLDQDASEAEKISQRIASDIESNKIRLVDFVENLGRFLTDDDSGIRIKAVNCISSVLWKLPKSKLNAVQISMLCEFLSDRLEDEASLKECMTGLLALSKMERMPKSVSKSLVISVFERVDMRKHSQGTRYAIYQFLESVLVSNEQVKSINDEFIKGFLELCSGEKDPRNLMVVFGTFKTILTTLSIDNFVEQLFDATFCYFPITFRPPPDDPYGITSDDLKLKLRDCISASEKFAQYSFSSLIEKLTSSSSSVKKDTILTMIACVENYGPVTVGDYWPMLFDSVKFEVLHDGEDEVVTLICSLLTAITKSLSFGMVRTLPNSSLGNYLDAVVKECLDPLVNIQGRQAKPAAKILVACAEASYPASITITENSIPRLLSLVNSSSTATLSQQKTVLEILIMFIEASGALYGWRTDVYKKSDNENCLMPQKDEIFEFFCKSFLAVPSEEYSFRLMAMQGIVKMALLRDFLANLEMGLVVQYLDDIILTDNNNFLCEAALSSLKDLGRAKPDLILNIVFPAFLAQLPESDIKQTVTMHGGNKKHYRIVLAALADLCVNRGVFDTLTVRLLNRLQPVIKANRDAIYVQSILATLLLVIQRHIGDRDWDMMAIFNTIIPKLLSLTIVSTLQEESSAILSNDSVLTVIAKILNIFLRSFQPEVQEVFANAIFDLFIRGKECSLIDQSERSFVASNFRPLEVEYNRPRLLQILTMTIAGLQQSVALPVQNVLEFTTGFVSLADKCSSLHDRLAALRLISLVINKWFSKEQCEKFYSTTVAGLIANSDTSSSVTGRKLSIEILAWIAKALVYKSDRNGLSITEFILSLAADELIGKYASKACSIIIGDDEIVAKGNFVTIRLLAKQQFFSFVLPQVVEGFNRSSPEIKKNYLVALSRILLHMPGKIVVPQLSMFIPLLLQALALEDSQVKLAAIETITATISDASNLMSEHISTIIPRLLDSTTDTSYNTPKVRIAALNSLSLLPSGIPVQILEPHRSEVIRKLGRTLDDPKRDVRKAAVDCRQAYFAMEA
ncbi:Dos2-interacting transcription regulator of RNA-Pol-II-domain-containing protein [Dipodascopsis uninucleata]